MDAIDTATKRIAACEADIKALMTTLVAEGKYDELPALAALAARLSELTTSGNGRAEVSRSQALPRNDASAQDNAVDAKSRTAKQEPLDYPRFERSEDRLIKVGWSKKDREEYEHKASKEAARAVFDAIANASASRDFVRVEDVLRVRGKEEEEMPSYQIYLVIAWLRSSGALEREGNEGYRIKKKGLSFERLWMSTPAR